MEKTQICGLKGIGPGTKPYRVISLNGRTELVIGRNPENDVTIPSNMISRRHAVFRLIDGDWLVYDNKSLNGIHINNKKLDSETPYKLVEGDTVQLGVTTRDDKMADFVWTFHTHLKVRKIRPLNSQNVLSENDSENPGNVHAECTERDIVRKRSASQEAEEKTSPNKPTSPVKPQHKKARISAPEAAWSPSAEMRKKLKEQEEFMQQQLREQQSRLDEMQRLLQQRQSDKEQLQRELEMKEIAMKEELRKQQENLEAERQRYEEELRQNFEKQLKEKEDALFSSLHAERERLLEEKKRVDAELQKEMESKLDEKDKSYREQLLKEKAKLDKIIEQKEIHRKMLENQLKESKTESERQQQTVLQTKEDILSNFTDLIETELQCSICNELFVQATSLSCSHSYCAQCIEDWMKVKKECPVCRAPITSKIRSIVLDNYIDRMVEHLNDDMKRRRIELVKERKVEANKREEALKASAPKPGTSGRGRGRGGRRGGQRGRRISTPAVEILSSPLRNATQPHGVFTRSRAAPETEVVISSDNEPDVEDVAAYLDLGSDFTDEADSDNSDSGSSVEGDEDAYFGGYGHCFVCGHRGHWAQGCPFR